MTHYEEMAAYLTAKSREVCELNECTEDDHKCESYAYMSIAAMPCIDGKERLDVMLLDVCLPDYFRGTTMEYIALPLPFEGGADDLREAIEQEWLSLA